MKLSSPIGSDSETTTTTSTTTNITTTTPSTMQSNFSQSTLTTTTTATTPITPGSPEWKWQWGDLPQRKGDDWDKRPIDGEGAVMSEPVKSDSIASENIKSPTGENIESIESTATTDNTTTLTEPTTTTLTETPTTEPTTTTDTITTEPTTTTESKSVKDYRTLRDALRADKSRVSCKCWRGGRLVELDELFRNESSEDLEFEFKIGGEDRSVWMKGWRGSAVILSMACFNGELPEESIVFKGENEFEEALNLNGSLEQPQDDSTLEQDNVQILPLEREAVQSIPLEQSQSSTSNLTDIQSAPSTEYLSAQSTTTIATSNTTTTTTTNSKQSSSWKSWWSRSSTVTEKEKSTEKSTDKSTEKSIEKSTDKSTEKSVLESPSPSPSPSSPSISSNSSDLRKGSVSVALTSPEVPHVIHRTASPSPSISSLDSTSTTTNSSNVQYIKSLRLPSHLLKSLNLRPGVNTISYTVNTKLQGTATCHSRIFLWRSDARIVISDIDGTITKSDALGHLFTMVGKDWTHVGVASLYSKIAANGYEFLYLTSRAIGQAASTRGYLKGVEQDRFQLPDGPIIMSPDRLFTALHREVIQRRPDEFKIACLRDIQRLFIADEESVSQLGSGVVSSSEDEGRTNKGG